MHALLAAYGPAFGVAVILGLALVAGRLTKDDDENEQERDNDDE